MEHAAIIHLFSLAAGGVGAGLAPVPGSDAPVLVSLQTTMVQALANDRGVPLNQAAAAELVLSLSATMAGRAAVRILTAWVPGLGVVVSSTTAAALTEAVGWAAVRWFDGGHR